MSFAAFLCLHRSAPLHVFVTGAFGMQGLCVKKTVLCNACQEVHAQAHDTFGKSTMCMMTLPG